MLKKLKSQKINVTRYKLHVTLLILASCVLLLASFVNAQQVIPLTASPARQEILVDPSEQQTISVRFLNQGDSPISGIIRVADFIVDNKDGIPRILEDSSQ